MRTGTSDSPARPSISQPPSQAPLAQFDFLGGQSFTSPVLPYKLVLVSWCDVLNQVKLIRGIAIPIYSRDSHAAYLADYRCIYMGGIEIAKKYEVPSLLQLERNSQNLKALLNPGLLGPIAQAVRDTPYLPIVPKCLA